MTLLGDAAHPMYPTGSNGSAQAILDAKCLARLLSELAPEAALNAYEAERLPKTAEVVRNNRRGGPERVLDLVAERAPKGFNRSIRSAVGSEPAKVYQAGESFHEEPGAHHSVSENASATEPASLLAVFIVDAADEPLTTPD